MTALFSLQIITKIAIFLFILRSFIIDHESPIANCVGTTSAQRRPTYDAWRSIAEPILTDHNH